MSTLISVNIQTRGFWPTEPELAARDAAITELSEQKIGSHLGAGAGAGGMDFEFEVSDRSAAKAMISETLAKHFPESSYSVESMPAMVAKDEAATHDMVQEHGKSKGCPKTDFGWKI